MTNLKRAVAMTLVATALCADRTVAAPVVVRAHAEAPVAGRLVARLSVSLRRSVSSIRLVQTRRENDRIAVPIVQQIERPVWTPVSLSPFQFRLPPPLV